jgi:hypothetical protein
MDPFKARKIAFSLGSLFLIFLLLFASVKTSIFGTLTKDQMIESVEKKIKELEEMKRGYESRALKHDSQGDRLQFAQGQLNVAKKHWDLAEQNRAVAKKLQQDIDAYNLKRNKLLEEMGIKATPIKPKA